MAGCFNAIWGPVKTRLRKSQQKQACILKDWIQRPAKVEDYVMRDNFAHHQ